MRSDTVDTIDTGDGNTESSPGSRARCWFLTWNNVTDKEKTAFAKWCDAECEEAQVQHEVGESGTPHLQGCIKFKSARYFSALKKKWSKPNWQTCKSWKDAVKYCSKPEGRLANVVTKCKPKYRCRDPMEGLELKEWQRYTADFLATKNDRQILWVYDEQGCAGKTTFCKSICIRNPKAILVGGKAADMKCGVAKMVEAEQDPDIILIDCPRSMEDYFSYGGVEEIKNGIFFSGKYESGMVIFECPQVVVMANFLPDIEKMSRDRWVILDVIHGLIDPDPNR